ncbi:MAG: DUF1501 domain-containing protein [Planctomycetes bacterium]|nr:DUF1501 domain-containing protein [Planctomycetota bacterium]
MPTPDLSSISPPAAALTGRRAFLQVGYSGVMGLGLNSLLGSAGQSAPRPSNTPKAKSMILVWMTGAPSHHDTFDMKPDAPDEIRGEFKPIATKVPGFQICEHLPQLAAQADKYAIIRSLSHGDNNHLMSTHWMLTGHTQPGGFFDKVASRDDWPCYSSALNYFRPRTDELPTGVNLPTFMMASPLTWPGQHAGMLGPKHDPWQIVGDPNAKDFKVQSLQLMSGIDVGRFNDRQELLDQINRRQRELSELSEIRRLTDQQQQAFSLLTSSRFARAFELDKASDAERDRYGRNRTGQSLLLARRLVDVGVPVVQVNIGGAQTWDHHSNIFPSLKNLLPPVDQGMSALLEDLAATGALDQTLVVMMGEFGRTPKVNAPPGATKAGRDHWGPCFFGLFAGAGVRGGQVIGKSDRHGAYPMTKPYAPEDVGATIYHLLGVPPDATFRDRLNRPLVLNHGEVIEPLFTAAAT